MSVLPLEARPTITRLLELAHEIPLHHTTFNSLAFSMQSLLIKKALTKDILNEVKKALLLVHYNAWTEEYNVAKNAQDALVAADTLMWETFNELYLPEEAE